ncbi:hypothetical protein [Flavobacterium sp.]|uniref:hypothetical protein n=1 Tax=Flavobacterium sp. TaxID=239 RepID=UPI003F6A1B47
MKNLKIFALSFFVFALNSVVAQNQETLEKETNKMYEATLKMDFDKIIEYTYPKIFDLVPKDQLKGILQQTFDNDEFKMEFVAVNPNFEYGKVSKIEEKSLAIINYKVSMTMTFYEELEQETIDLMINTFKAAGSYDEVNYDLDKKAFIIATRTKMIAVSDELTKKQWKFITYDKKNRKIAEMLLSDSILTKLGL